MVFQELDNLFREHFGSDQLGNDVHVDVNSEGENDNDTDNVDESTDRLISDRVSQYLNQDSNEGTDEQQSERVGENNIDELNENFRCHCVNNCFTHFTESEVWEHIYNMREMTKEEKEMYIMGTLKQIGTTKLTLKRKERKRIRHSYSFHGHNVCREVFLVLYDVGDKVLLNITKHMMANGVVPREHGNKGKRPVHALKFQDIENAVAFIRNYAEEVGMPQPEAPRGSDGIPPIYLPSSDTKKGIHERYVKSCEETEMRVLKISSFEDVWLKCVPHIKISSPRDDVCHRCECLRKSVLDAVTEEDKLAAIEAFQRHISDAKKEREHYRTCIETALREMDRWSDGASDELKDVHYTFDFAQHFQLPHHSRQMGPTYFAQLRRVQLFGIRLDSISKQLNYVIDEDQTIGTICY